MKKIADGQAWTMPATIDDPVILEEIGGALQAKGLGGYSPAQAARRPDRISIATVPVQRPSSTKRSVE
jgi:hypothetical protein